MSNTTKKLTAGLLMAATTFTANGTCFANQVGFFNDGTGCETAKCYRDLWYEMSYANGVLRTRIYHDKLPYEDDLMKKYYPEVFEKIELAKKSLQGSANAEEFRQNLEKMYGAAAQYCQETESYKNNINEENRFEIAERTLAGMGIDEKMSESFNKAYKGNNNVKKQDTLSYEFYHKQWKNCAVVHPDVAFNEYIESEKAFYDYWKQTAAELGFDISNHEKLIAQLKKCEKNPFCIIHKHLKELPTNQYLAFKQNIEVKEPQASQKPSILSKLAPYAIGVVAAVILALPRILGRGQVPHANVD